MSRPLFEVTAYQDRINAVTGGKQIVRLSWAPEILRWNPRPIGTTPESEFIPQHTAISGPKGEPIAPPRWMLEERIEPETYFERWNENRYFRDPGDGLLHDLRGPAPREGDWRWIETIRSHDSHCCEMRMRGMVVCWGYYKEPGKKELKLVRDLWAKIQHDKGINPFAKAEHLEEDQNDRDLASRMRNEKRARKESATAYWLDKLQKSNLDLPTLRAVVTRGIMKNDESTHIPTLHKTVAAEAAQRKFSEEPT